MILKICLGSCFFVEKPILLMPCLSLPHSVLFLWRAPGKGWRALGPILPPTLFVRPIINAAEIKITDHNHFSESVIGCWFVWFLTMAADWVTCYVPNIWAGFLAPLPDGSRGSLHNTEQHFKNNQNCQTNAYRDDFPGTAIQVHTANDLDSFGQIECQKYLII